MCECCVCCHFRNFGRTGKLRHVYILNSILNLWCSWNREAKLRESRWYFRLTRTFQDAVIFSLDNCYWQNLRLENVFAIHMIEVKITRQIEIPPCSDGVCVFVVFRLVDISSTPIYAKPFHNESTPMVSWKQFHIFAAIFLLRHACTVYSVRVALGCVLCSVHRSFTGGRHCREGLGCAGKDCNPLTPGIIWPLHLPTVSLLNQTLKSWN